MARKSDAMLGFDALSIEGGLLSPVWLGKVAQLLAGGQEPGDYRIPKGLSVRDEIGRYWRIAQAHWAEFKAGGGAAPQALSERFVTAFLREVLGFASLAISAGVTVGDRTWPVRHSALGGRVPVVIAPARVGLETPDAAFGDEGRRRTAFGLLQEFLNAEERALWGIASDGVTLRIARDNASLTRPAWIEADLASIFADERYADFAALWLLAHESRFGAADRPPTDCPLETWRNAGREEGTRARERLREGVEDALLALGNGFLGHPGNQVLRESLRTNALTRDAFFQQLLRLVYRLIFLITAEERGVLHAVRDTLETRRYAEGYSLRRLRERSVRRSAHDRFSDLWQGLLIVLRGLAAGESSLALPALAGLFARDQCPTLDAAGLENRALLQAIYRLCWLRDDAGLVRVNWRDMGPEELGSVYESLLELVPRISSDGRSFSFAAGNETRGNARKSSGSYYTPDTLVQVLLDSALEPVVADTIARNPADPVEALLSLSIVDPACGSGHFLLAAARRVAAHVARLRANGTPSPPDYRHALRQVVGRCIYGVDLNPMAVELCKVSLWMEAVEPGLPLTFLNSHIQQGNALLGTTPELMVKGIPDAAWEPIEGDDKKVASALKKRNKMAAVGQRGMEALWAAPAAKESEDVARAVAALDAAADTDAEALANKERTWDELRASRAYQQQKFIADSYCAAFFWPKQPGARFEPAPTNELWRQIRDGRGERPTATVTTVEALTRHYRFFHWHLAFPQVFARGGFDLVLGNPPWDTLSPDAKEFFSVYGNDIRSQSKAEQEATIAGLLTNPAIDEAWKAYRRDIFGSAQFLKESGRFTLFAPGNLGKGDFNVFRLFVELALRSARRDGWAAQVVPEGIYAGANSMAIRKEIFEHFRLKEIIGFENARKHWFPSVHPQYKFALYSAQKGGATTDFRAVFAIRTDEELRAALTLEGAVRFSVAMVREFSPESLAIMEFGNRRDIDITRKMYDRWPPLGRVVPGTAHRAYLRELESGHVQELLTEDRSKLPHYEGRMIAQYDHRAKGYRSGRARSAVWADLPFGSIQKSVQPQWYVAPEGIREQAKARVGKYRVGFCDVTSPSTERSFVATMLPRDCIAGDSVPTVLMNSATPHVDLLVWLAVANSFAMDFLVRKKVSLHLKLIILDSLPFPRLSAEDPATRFLIPRVLRLVCTGPEMNALWDEMAKVGVVGERPNDSSVPGTWEDHERLILIAEIEYEVARLYGLSRVELEYILDSFSLLRKNDEQAHGKYRTRDVILEVYDEMAEAARAGKPYQTRLDPPPADPRVAHPARDAKVIPLRPTVRPHPEVGTAVAAIVPDLGAVGAEDWSRPHTHERGEVQAAVLAVLKACETPLDRRQARLAALLCLEPHLLVSHLDSAERANWARVVGADARKASNASTDGTTQEWGAALSGLRARGRLTENLQQNTWEIGAGTDAIDTRGWADGRAGFVVNVLRRLQASTQVDAIIFQLPTPVRQWLEHAA